MNLTFQQTKYPLAEILRDETTISNQYENGFKILTQDGHVLYIEEETLYQIVYKTNSSLEIFTIFEASIYAMVWEVDVSEDGTLCYVDLTFTDVSITCHFALNIIDLYRYNDIYLHEEEVKVRVENKIFQPWNINIGGVAC